MGLYIAGFGVFFLIMGVPIAFALGLTTLFTAMIWARVPMTLIYQQLYQAVDNFVLLAIPLFMLAGDLMLRAGIIDDIITLCNVLVGRLRGGPGARQHRRQHVLRRHYRLGRLRHRGARIDSDPVHAAQRLRRRLRRGGHLRLFGDRADHPAEHRQWSSTAPWSRSRSAACSPAA